MSKPKALLIAEKPSLMRTIESVYNAHKTQIPFDCTFLAQSGHLLTLKMPPELDPSQTQWAWDNLPFHPEEHGGWEYKVVQAPKTGNYPTPQERYDAIKNELNSGKYDFVIHAGDPDQEGELLVRIVLNSLKCSIPVKRFWSNDTTDAKVLNALQNLLDDDNDPMLVNLTKAGLCRQHTDYRYGTNLSEAVSLQMDGTAAVGRVMTWMLAMICRREDEIKHFVPHTTYGIKAEYSKGFMGQLYDPNQVTDEKDEKNDKDDDKSSGFIYFDTEKEAQDFIAKLPKTATVEDCTVTDADTYAPKLFKLASAQIAAGKMGYSSDKTQSIIQSLYEKGYLSYPRTDCEYISSHENYVAMIQSAMAVPELVPYIKTISTSTIEKVRNTKKWVNDKALQEHGHSALTPTSKKPDLSKLSQEEIDIYTLICRQFIAIFMPPLKTRKTVILVDIGGNKFRSSGKEVIDKGYTTILGQNIADTKIPACTKGEQLSVVSYQTDAKTSKCPPHLSDVDLIAICEAPHKYLEDESLKALGKALHIGTPATRSNIIEKLLKNKYLEWTKEGRKTYLSPTANGYEIYNNLKDNEICKTDLTGQWEEQLELIRQGKLSPKEFETKMIKHVNHLVDIIYNTRMTKFKNAKKGNSLPVIAPCPKCGKQIISGPKGFFCSGYKDGCKIGSYKQICDSTITDAEFVKMLNGETIVKQLKKGSSSWPQPLKYNMNEGKIEFAQAQAKESSFHCPSCNSLLKDELAKISCPSCSFTLWKNQCGKQLSDDDIASLLTKGSTKVIKGMKSKKGNKFDAKIVLKKDKSGTEFSFT